MKIIIMSRERLTEAGRTPFAAGTAVISITDKGTPPVLLAHAPMALLRLSFADVSEEEIREEMRSGVSRREAVTALGAITEEDGARIAAFYRAVRPHALRLIVACEHGQSRSAAVAAALLEVRARAGIRVFADERYFPNKTVYRTVKHAIEEDQKMEKEKWCARVRAVTLGHAVADALGVPVEFASRAELAAAPVTEMRGFGTYPVPAGSFSDDTSMALCALDSLSTGVFDPADVMARFARWYYEDAYTPSGEMFDVGATCAEAIERYRITGKWEGCARSDERANGNGALMRIYPFVLFAYAKGLTEDARDGLIATATALTHGHPRAALGCMIYAHVLCRLLDAPTHESVREALASAAVRYASHAELAHYARVLSPDFERTPKESIRSGGYCVDTLEAALYTLLTTESYEACVLSAVNLGDDTDTTAATVGALAGARYGEDAIPNGWLSALLRRPWIEEMCESFAACAKASTTAP